MNLSRTTRRLVVATAVVASTATMPAFARAQDSLARAKDFYAAAAYEEALVVLQRLNAANPGTDRNEVAAYQAFCLVALGRSEEARKTIESLVRMDPLYKLSEAQASPRVRAFFDDVRRPLLPEIVKQTYSRAKDAYDRKELTSAATEFDRAIALIDEVGSANDRALADLRTLASGFRDLAKAAAAPPPPPPPPAAATEGSTGNASTAANGTAAGGTTGATNGNAGGTSAAPGPSGVKTPPAAPAAPESEPTYGPRDTDVTRPVAVKRTMPEWRPSLVEAMIEFNGSLELLIGTDGKVLSAAITDSIHPGYDTQLKQAALGWSFRPATKGGKPVRYRYALDIQLKK